MMPRLLRRLAAGFLILLTALCCLLAPASSTPVGGVPNQFNYLPLILNGWDSVTPSRYLGVGYGGDDLGSLGLAREVTAGFVTVPFEWSVVQPTAHSALDFSAYDPVVWQIRNASMQPVLRVQSNPPWASEVFGNNCGPIDDEDLPAFQAFMAGAVAHYREDVFYWQLYNEPDNTDVVLGTLNGGCWGADEGPQRYGQLLMLAYAAVHPDFDQQYKDKSRLIFGGLGHDLDPVNPLRYNRDFLLQAYVKDSFDILGFRYRSRFEHQPTWDPEGDGWQGVEQKQRELALMLVALGDGARQMMLTDLTWDSDGDEENRANFAVRAVAQALSVGIRPIVWGQLKGEFGLVSEAGLQRPAWYAYRTTGSELGSADYYLGKVVARDVKASGPVDGYVFASGAGPSDRWVLWATGEPVTITIPEDVQKVSGRDGGKISLSPGDQYLLGASPIFLQY